MGLLRLNDHVDTNRDALIDKHPSGQPGHPESLIKGDPPEVHPAFFESIDSSMVRWAALRTTGAAGPSGLDAASWRRLCTSFWTAWSVLHNNLERKLVFQTSLSTLD